MSMNNRVKAYVRLLDEGIDVWRPCYVRMVRKGVAIVLPDEYLPEDFSEEWECKPGDIVSTEIKGGKMRIFPL